MYGGISERRMGPYPPRGALALYTNTSQSAIGWWDWGFHTVQGGVDQGKSVFVPVLSEL